MVREKVDFKASNQVNDFESADVTTKELSETDAMDQATMKKFDRRCLSPVKLVVLPHLAYKNGFKIVDA